MKEKRLKRLQRRLCAGCRLFLQWTAMAVDWMVCDACCHPTERPEQRTGAAERSRAPPGHRCGGP
eukprot:8659923-Lingulodinium_polyedra.AAC.1